MNELMFMGVNIPKEIENLLNEKEPIITNGMNENELKAYKLGVKNTLSALIPIITSFDEHIIIHTEDEKYQCELDIKDLRKIIND